MITDIIQEVMWSGRVKRAKCDDFPYSYDFGPLKLLALLYFL